MMRRRTDEEIQAFLEKSGGAAEAPADWSAEDRACLRAYALVFEALGDDPGYALAPDFAERVAARVTPRRRRFPWFEAVVTPALVAAAAVVYVPPAVAAWLAALRQPDSGARAVLDAIEAGRLDLVLGALLVLALLAAADRVLRKIAPTARAA